MAGGIQLWRRYSGDTILNSPPSAGGDLQRKTIEPVQVTKQNVPVGWYLVKVFAYESDDGTGQVIAEAETQVEVTMGQTAQVNLITEALVVTVEIKPCPVQLELGGTATLTATAYDADGKVILGATFDWELSDPQVAQFSGTGILVPVAVGACSVTATEIASQIADTCPVNVFRRETAYVLVVPDEHELYPPQDSTVQLTGTAYDASDQPIPYAVIVWNSTDPTVATVDPTGLVTATVGPAGLVKAGGGGGAQTTVITADAGEGTPGTSLITVTPVGGLGITVQGVD